MKAESRAVGPVSTRCAAAVGVCVLVASCGPRGVELGFWLEPLSFASSRIGEPISQAEYGIIEQVARAEIARAFEDYDATVTANRQARYRVIVVPHLRDNRLVRRSGTYAGESRAVAGFGGSGAVSFEYVANGAMVFVPDDATRATIVESIGRGVGRVAIHEFVHQLLPKVAIHDSKDTRSYEGNSPALIEGYFGDLHWDIAAAALEQRIGRSHP
jgi:hypothetical protein